MTEITETLSDCVQVEITCPHCLAGDKPYFSPKLWRAAHKDSNGSPVVCDMFDAQFRHRAEPYGWTVFAWLPKKLRNGAWTWLQSVERHGKNDYTMARLK